MGGTLVELPCSVSRYGSCGIRLIYSGRMIYSGRLIYSGKGQRMSNVLLSCFVRFAIIG